MKAGWEIRTLGDACQIARGGSPRPIQQFLTDDPDGVNWIKISDGTASGKFIYETKEKIKPSGVSRSRLVNPGDFLLSNSMSFGRPYIMQTTGCIHDGWLVLSDYEKCFDQTFLYHLLGSPVVFEQFNRLAAGSTVRNLNIELASRVSLPVPPLPEQHRIVAILDEAFDGIATAKANAEKNLQNTRALFESHLQSVLTERGEGWVTTTLGECFRLKSGDGLTSKAMKAGKYPVYGGNGIAGMHDEFNLSGDNVIIGRVGALCGNARCITERIWLTDNAFKIVDFSYEFDSAFLTYLLNFKNLRGLARQAAQPVISNSSLKDLVLDFPAQSEQQRIAIQLDALVVEIERLASLYQQKLTALDALKKSLLHQAFSGKL